MQKNTVVFLILSFLILIGWFALQRWLFPPQPAKPAATNSVAKKTDKPDQPGVEAKAPAPVVLCAPPPRRTHPFLTLGDDNFSPARDPRSPGRRGTTGSLQPFQEGRRYGPAGAQREPRARPRGGEPRGAVEPAVSLHAGNSDRPLDTLGKEEWVPRVLEPGKKVEFVYNKLPDVILTKTYSLAPGDYHISLDVRVERKLVPESALPFLQAIPVPGPLNLFAQQAALSGKLNFDPVSFQYQLTSAHGLPIEGKWYTSIFRNALVGQVDQNGNLWRELQDLHTISKKLGGDTVNCDQGKFIRYAGVAVQYFASMIVVSDEQERGMASDFLLRTSRRSTPVWCAAKSAPSGRTAPASSWLLTRKRIRSWFRAGRWDCASN